MQKINKEIKRLAIIGSGPSGICLLRAFVDAHNKGIKIPEVVCYDKQSDVGGIWNYSWRVGTDENGESVHSSMYRHLWSNGPKECLEFPDYKLKEHFGTEIPSFPPRPVLYDYLKGYLSKGVIKGTTDTGRSWIRFSTAVRDVQYNEQKDEFNLTAFNHSTKKTEEEVFDSVVVATGHFSVPNYVSFPGFDNFQGLIIHSHDFRNAESFKGKNLVMIGASYSAEDIGSQCYKFGAKHISISHRRKGGMGFKWPKEIEEKALVERVEGNTVYYVDGTKEDNVDTIILCTGFKHYFPFLPDNLRLDAKNVFWVDLWEGVMSRKNKKLFYMAMTDQFYTYTLFQSQAWLVRDLVLGKINIPDQAEIDRSTKEWEVKHDKLNGAHDQIVYQSQYIDHIASLTDYKNFNYNTKEVNQRFFEWEDNKVKDIMTFRDISHRNVFDGEQSPLPKTVWARDEVEKLEEYKKLYCQKT